MTIDSTFATLAPILISSLSLIVAFISFVMNYRLNKREKQISEELAKLQLEKEKEAAERRASSKVEAHHILVGLKNHCIRVANTGGTTVTNVTCECDKDNAPYAFIQNMEPFERLEPGESFDESVLFASDSPRKFIIITHWLGADGEAHSRENIVTW